MNNAIVILLNSVERANQVVAPGIIIDETLTPGLAWPSGAPGTFPGGLTAVLACQLPLCSRSA